MYMCVYIYIYIHIIRLLDDAAHHAGPLRRRGLTLARNDWRKAMLYINK